MTFEKETACAFSGHRIISNSDWFALEQKTEEIIKKLITRGFKTFITGGALGFDTMAAQCVLRQKKENAIRLAVIQPCRDQSEGWSGADKDIYDRILSCADEVICLSEKYHSGCMQSRNRFMVDNSSVLVAYLTKMRGGTLYTVNYAQNEDREIIFVR